MTQEEWRPVAGFEGYYEVSSLGKVRRILGKELAPRVIHGYEYVSLSKEGKISQFRVHRIVAGNFLSNPDNHPVVHHKDENKRNNRVDNLIWCTIQFNSKASS